MPNEWMRNRLRQEVVSLSGLRTVAAGLVLFFIAGCTITPPSDRTEVEDQKVGAVPSQPNPKKPQPKPDPEPELPDDRVLQPEPVTEPPRPDSESPERAAKADPEPPAKKPEPAPEEKAARTPVAEDPAPAPAPRKQPTPARAPVTKPVEKPVEKPAEPEPAKPAQNSRDEPGKTASAPAQAADASPPVPDDESVESGDPEQEAVEESPLPVVSLDSLPMTFGQWELDLRSWSTGTVDCVLRSPTIDFFDGYEQSRLSVKILDHALVVETESAVDLSYEETGIRLQPDAIMPFTKVVNTNGVELSQDKRGELARATEFTLLMGFWPTWPRTGIREIPVPLEGLRPAVAALELCQKL